MPEVAVEGGVDDGIERRVGVADPEERRDDHRRRAHVGERMHDIPDEERQPANEERPHYDAERLRRLVLPAHLLPVLLQAARVERPRAVVVATVLRRVRVRGPHCRFERLQRDGCGVAQAQYTLLLAARLAEDLEVGEEHDDGRAPEGDRRRHDAVDLVDDELADVQRDVRRERRVAFALHRRRRVPAEVDGRVRQEGGRAPRQHQHGRHPAARHAPLVAERVGDGDVAVGADAAEV